MRFSIENSILGKQFIGIEYCSDNQSDKAQVLSIKKTNNTLEIVAYTDDIFLEKKTGVFITINNNQILHKTIDKTNIIDDKILKKAFPSINPLEFYYSILHQKNTCLVSICRKSYLDNIIATHANNGTKILGIAIGVSNLTLLTSYFTNQTINTNNQSITIDSSNDISAPIKQHATEIDYTINGLAIHHTQLINFAGIVSVLNNHTTITGSIADLNTNYYKNYIQDNFYKKGRLFCISSIFIILLINFFIFNYFFHKEKDNHEVIQLNTHQLKQIQKLEYSITQKEKKANDIIASQSSNSTQYLHQICHNVPSTISFDMINYCPVATIKNKKQIEYESQQILIDGFTKNNADFRNWLSQLEQLEWIQKCTILTFGKGKFSIKIAYHEILK